MSIKMVMELVELGIMVANGIPEARDAYVRLQQMVSEGRDPTSDEFAELAAITKSLHERIQAG